MNTTKNQGRPSGNPDIQIHRTLSMPLADFDSFKETIRGLGTNNNSEGFKLILKAYQKMKEESEGMNYGTIKAS